MTSEEKSYIESPYEAVLLKYITEDITAEEKVWVEKWIEEDTNNELVVIQLARIYYAQKTHQRIKQRNVDLAFQKVQKRISKKTRRIFLRRASVAASLIIGILGIGSFLFQYSHTSIKEITPSLITVYSKANQHSQIVLPDGTEIYLNSGSVVTYPTHFSGKERKVKLEGEAYFKVAHNDKQPFVVGVSNDKLNVKVLGTEFNLQAYEEDNLIQATLVKGSVQLNIEGEKKTRILTPSEKAVYNMQTNDLHISNVNTERETDWMYNRLVFKETPMKEVLARLSRFYNVEFEVKNNIINTYTFTGTFQEKPLFQVLDYMKISSGITYTITYTKDEKGTKSVVELTK